jgi:DNA-binding NtrC family response regulator/tetratricopeptide (TPR) repeat protein
MRHDLDFVLDLIDYGQYVEARAALDTISQPTCETQLLSALIEIDTGNPERAADGVSGLLERRLSVRERILHLFVMGRVAYILGRPEASAHFRQAVRLALNSGDRKLLARAQGRLASFALHRVSIESALPELALLRRYAFAAGDSHALTIFHCRAAEIEMKRGKYGAALKHLRDADALVADTADVAMRATADRLRANVALFSSDPQVALAPCRRAVEILERTGAKHSLIATLSTLGHIHTLLGSFSAAESALNRVLALSASLPVMLSTFDGLLKVALARRDAAAAKKCITSIDSLGSFGPDHYDWLWHIPTRATWLVQEGRFHEAGDLLRQHAQGAAGSSDHRLLTKFVLAEVETLIAGKHALEAAGRLSAAVASLPTITLEDFVDINTVAARLAPLHSESFVRRSQRAKTIAFSGTIQTYPLTTTAPGESRSNVLHAAGSLFGIGLHSELLAHEIADLLWAADCVTEVQITTDADQKSVTAASLDAHAATSFIEVGGEIGPGYRVLARPRHGTESQMALMGVQLLARAANSLAEARRRERFEPSVWPESLSDHQFGMVVAAETMKQLIDTTRRVATSNATVLITGESGIGKELLARALHQASHRSDKPFTPFNCTAVSREMLDSQLFGYRRGAFTGAQEAFAGVIRAAAGGTLFLDEIGELPLDIQPKLLRFLEAGEIHPLGEPRPINVDVRIVAATNANLEALVEDGRFREDLFYRLNVVRLQVPPLRERREEIPLLVQHFLDSFCREARKTGIRLAEQTMEYLVLYKWPGNVRQLANELRRMVALGEPDTVLMPEHLSHEIASSRRTIPTGPGPTAPTEFVVRMDQPLSAAMEHLERSMIRYALAAAGERLEDAARMLGLSRKGLYLKRQRLKMATDAADAGEQPVDKLG